MPLFWPSRVLRAASSATVKWSDTLALPKSAFPPRPSASQLELYRKRCADELYAWQRTHRAGTIQGEDGGRRNNEFVLHDGPPYANGAVHVGHALNKVLKDLILRSELAKGKKVHYKPGWDCHGLPIELKALQAHRTRTEQTGSLQDAPKLEDAAAIDAASMTAPQIRRIARQLAAETIEKQKVSFQSWGVLGEWETPYTTMSKDFEIKQLEVFQRMVKQGLVYRERRPVYWSPSSRTALAEAELEYDDQHKCTAAYVKLPMINVPRALEQHPSLKAYQIDHHAAEASSPPLYSALIWTTTPWTLPANQAVAVNGESLYSVIRLGSQREQHGSSPEYILVADNLVQHILSILPSDTNGRAVVGGIPGHEIAVKDSACWNPFQDTLSPIVEADFVTATSGTGLVHMAPGHGMEDYQVCKAHGFKSDFAPVDDEGRFTDEVFANAIDIEQLRGLDVQQGGAQAVIELLSRPSNHFKRLLEGPWSGRFDNSLVFATHQYVHKNPIDWRTKQPVIVRATAQWFAEVSRIKVDALNALHGVNFIPDSGRTRLQSFIEGRSQWCISRQRAWGVPIPVLYSKQTNQACVSGESITHIIKTIEEKGVDAWFSDPPDDESWIHPSLLSSGEHQWVRGNDTMDVWFDSGTTWTTLDATKRQNQPLCDVYLEGSDQHRGWFQSSLLTYIATQNDQRQGGPVAPFRKLITHGFTLDAEGKKMSKSLGNVISPDQIVDGSLLPPLKAKKQKPKTRSASSVGPDGVVQYDAMGPDVLRLWVASSDYTRDVSISVPVLQSVQQALQKYRVTFKFLLGVLKDWDKNRSDMSRHQHELSFADRATLHQLRKTSSAVRSAYDEYKFYKAVNDINVLINADLSAFYFEIIKDAMYTGSRDVRARTQAALKQIFDELLTVLAPITPHLVEEVWEHRPAGMLEEKHPLQRTWSEAASGLAPPEDANSDDISTGLAIFRGLSQAVKVAQEEARTAGNLRSGLACKVVVNLTADTPAETSSRIKHWYDRGELADMLVVSQVECERGDQQTSNSGGAWTYQQFFTGGKVQVLPPEHHKCVRCWKHTSAEPDRPCERCRNVMKENELFVP